MNKASTNTALRSPETWERYQNAPKRKEGYCFMCKLEGIVIVKKFKHWYIVKNQYPYDTVAEVHHLLVPRDHIAQAENLTDQCTEEAATIMEAIEFEGFYDCMISNFPSKQSQKQHFHVHLVKWKRV